MQARMALGVGKVSCLGKCPQFRGVLIARGVPLWVRAKLRYLCTCHSSGYGCS